MSGHAASPRFGTPGVTPELREATREMTGYWRPRRAAVGAREHPELRPHHCGRGRGLDLGFFGMLLLVAAVICFISPEGTFAALADILG